MKGSFRWLIAILILAGCGDDPRRTLVPGIGGRGPLVRNVVAQVQESGSVRITYDLEAEADKVRIDLSVSDDGGLTFLVPTNEATGDIGDVPGGTGRVITWPVAPGLAGTTLQARVVAVGDAPPAVGDMAAAVDSLRLRADLEFLQGVRHYAAGLQHITDTKDYIEKTFRDHGVQASRQPFPHGSWTGQNIIGRHPGLLEEEVVYIVDGHFDTVPSTPGVDDNATGTAGMIEAMRILSAYSFERSIKFIGFDLEERGLVGSRYYVQNGIPDWETTGGVYNFEMIGFTCHTPGCDAFRELGNYISNVSNPPSNELRFLFDDMAAIHAPDLIVASVEADDNPNFRRSDHWPFWQAGIRAVFLPDGANFRNPHYHQASDTVDTIDFAFMTNIVKTTVACLAALAGPIDAGIGFAEPFTIEP